jgi:predicted O-methyltransferase YrrM
VTLHEEYLARLGTWSDIQAQMPLLHDAARAYPQVKVLELGVRTGNSTAAFLAAADGAGGRVWSADISPPVTDTSSWEASGVWTFLHGDDLTVTPEEVPGVPLRPDVLFIDTNHEYEHTLAELRKFVPMIAAGGIALMHDTLLTWDRPEYQVARALDEFCGETRRAWTEISEPPYGLGQILYPNGP